MKASAKPEITLAMLTPIASMKLPTLDACASATSGLVGSIGFTLGKGISLLLDDLMNVAQFKIPEIDGFILALSSQF